LNFADRFESTFIGQGMVNRSAEETLDLAWQLLGPMPVEALKRIPTQFIEKYHGKIELEAQNE
jgi:V/A-type H+-transporting ATPase subunit B